MFATEPAELKQYEEAIDDYTKAIELEILDPEKRAYVYYNRGNAQIMLDQHQEAIEDYTQAIEPGTLDSKTLALAYNNRANIHTELDQHKEAIEDYTEAIKLKKLDSKILAGAYYNRGNALFILGKENQAKDDFLRSITLTREGPPGSLYQYIPVNRKRLLSLINGEVYFAQYTQLNDPLECLFLNQSDLPMGGCLRQFAIEPRICSMVPDMDETASKPMLMYAHYADDHKGLCVEYELNFDSLNSQENVAYGYVDYEQDHKLSSLKNLYMLKNSDWEYEKEFRIVRFGKQEFEPAHIKSITFGLRCPVAHRQIIYYLLPKDLNYYEMAHEGEGNQVVKKLIYNPEETLALGSDDIFRLMLQSDLVHLYFYHQQKQA